MSANPGIKQSINREPPNQPVGIHKTHIFQSINWSIHNDIGLLYTRVSPCTYRLPGPNTPTSVFIMLQHTPATSSTSSCDSNPRHFSAARTPNLQSVSKCNAGPPPLPYQVCISQGHDASVGGRRNKDGSTIRGAVVPCRSQDLFLLLCKQCANGILKNSRECCEKRNVPAVDTPSIILVSSPCAQISMGVHISMHTHTYVCHLYLKLFQFHASLL